MRVYIFGFLELSNRTSGMSGALARHLSSCRLPVMSFWRWGYSFRTRAYRRAAKSAVQCRNVSVSCCTFPTGRAPTPNMSVGRMRADVRTKIESKKMEGEVRPNPATIVEVNLNFFPNNDLGQSWAPPGSKIPKLSVFHSNLALYSHFQRFCPPHPKNLTK